jgi:single-strand binding family protein
MNEVFLIGNIVNEIEFKFIINSKNISIAMFNIELDDKQIIKVKAYNEIADYCYSKLKNTDRIFINGELSGIYVIVKDIKRCINR